MLPCPQHSIVTLVLWCAGTQVMGSAKRPLWLVFKNADPLGQKIILMFKSGDDLRQDTVTLQVRPCAAIHTLWVCAQSLCARMVPVLFTCCHLNDPLPPPPPPPLVPCPSVRQLIRVMDKLWRSEGLDLRLTPYRCIATWPMGGILEIVRESMTTADIQKRYGGRFVGAFRDDTFQRWIREVSGWHSAGCGWPSSSPSLVGSSASRPCSPLCVFCG
jgi:hypothetical protein